MNKKKILILNLVKICLFFCTVLLLMVGLSVSAKAAVSTQNIRTESGGRFIQNSKGDYYYKRANGRYARNCLLEIDGKTYYFSAKGVRQYGWKKIENATYYFGKKSEGYMHKLFWIKRGKYTYFLRHNGKMAVNGLLTWQKKTYLFNKKGVRQCGWRNYRGKRYYFGKFSESYMYRSRFVTWKDNLYYLQEDGTMATGWLTVSGNTYYFDENGCAYTGKHKISGVRYYFTSEGVLSHSGANLKLSSKAAILVEAESGQILYEKNASLQLANASTTKILTCILALENCELDEIVRISEYAASQEESKLYMTAGDSFYLKDLLYSLMLPSHNDTAVAIAEHISGSSSEFADLMNAKAKQIGCTSTHFVTPNGLDAGLDHYTTVSDLSLIARYAWQNRTFRKIVGTSSYSFKSMGGKKYTVTTTNELLGNEIGVFGIKTGSTNKAGYCFVGAVTGQNGKTYISVTLGASTSEKRWKDSQKLLNYASNLA